MKVLNLTDKEQTLQVEWPFVLVLCRNTWNHC
jgi:hypothetical protein